MLILTCSQCGARASAMLQSLQKGECKLCEQWFDAGQPFSGDYESRFSAFEGDSLSDDEGSFRAYVYTSVAPVRSPI